MKELQKLLLQEQDRLQEIIKVTSARLEVAPEGTLRVSVSNGYQQYYQCAENGKVKYIHKESEDLIQKLAQKSYDEKVFRLAEKQWKLIKRLTELYGAKDISQVYYDESEIRRKLIVPVEQSWEERVREWKSMEYVGKEFQEGTPMIWTEKGERVRSKSEKIMADYFYRHGIEYKYECPLHLKGTGIVYPDFTFLSRKTKEEIYWEHNGMMDNATYAKNMVRKINAYERNGIFPGERLILTYETEQVVLNTDKIEQMVEKYL